MKICFFRENGERVLVNASCIESAFDSFENIYGEKEVSFVREIADEDDDSYDSLSIPSYEKIIGWDAKVKEPFIQLFFDNRDWSLNSLISFWSKIIDNRDSLITTDEKDDGVVVIPYL